MARLNSKRSSIISFISKYAIYIVLVILVVFMSIMSKGFLTSANILNIIRQNSFVGMVAIGMTFVIITAGIDLSVGAIMAFSGMVVARFCVEGEASLPLVLACIIGIIASALIGGVNGVLVTKGGIEPFIATLGMQTILRGSALVLNGGRPIINLNSSFSEIGQGSVLGLPIPVLVFLIVIIVTVLLLHFHKFGRRVFAIGGNEEATRASGISTDKNKIMVYVISAVLSGIAGIILAARVQSASPIAATGYELDAVAAVVIGGTSLAGGVGSMGGTIAGVFILGIVTNGLDLLNVSAYSQQIIKGLIILAAALLDKRVGVRRK